MFYTKILSFFLVFSIFSSDATIIQLDDMEKVFSYFKDADSKTLAIFDVDMVLIQPNDPAFQMANMKRFKSISKRIIQEVPADKQMIFLSLMTTSSAPVLIDERTPQFLQELKQRCIPTMALTANLTGSFGTIPNMEEWRIALLKKLGIDFSQTAPLNLNLVFTDLPSFRGNHSTYRDGILFVNGTEIPKGKAFIAFLEKTQYLPKKVIFIDDREDNVKSLEEALRTYDSSIEFQGIHFLGAQNYPSKIISEKEFESRWQSLASEANKLN